MIFGNFLKHKNEKKKKHNERLNKGKLNRNIKTRGYFKGA